MGSRFARALGLDPRKVRKIVLTIPCDDVISVEVEYLPDENEMKNLSYEVKEFVLCAPEK